MTDKEVSKVDGNITHWIFDKTMNRHLDLDDKLGFLLASDDKDVLISFMKVHRRGLPGLSPLLFVERMCSSDSVNCASALLGGELDLGIQIDVHTPIVKGVYVLHYAASYLSAGVIQVCLLNGARTDIRLVPGDVYEFQFKKDLHGLLPLDIALRQARCILSPAYLFPGLSVYKLIVSLRVGQMMHGLTAIKLLARSSEDIQKRAYDFAMQGQLIELAILLIVAREEVLAPVTYVGGYGTGSNGRMTILQCVNNEIQSLCSLKVELTGELLHNKSTEIDRDLMILRQSALLLEVFCRAGNSVEDYLHSPQPRDMLREHVENDVALMLKDAGFEVKDGDCWDCKKIPMMYPETPSDKSRRLPRPQLPLLTHTNLFSPQLTQIPGDVRWFSVCTSPLRRTHSFSYMENSININQVPKSIFGSGFSTSLDGPVVKGSKAIEQNVAKCLSRKKLACVAMLIKRGIRCA